MRYDRTQFDAALCLSHVRNPGRFAVEVTKGIRTIRRAFSMENENIDTLLARALLAGLDELKKQGFGKGSRIFVSSDTRYLVDAMTADPNILSLPFETRKGIWKAVQEFAITFRYRAEPALHIALANWLWRFPENELRQAA
jgi:hypothetical protein